MFFEKHARVFEAADTQVITVNRIKLSLLNKKVLFYFEEDRINSPVRIISSSREDLIVSSLDS